MERGSIAYGAIQPVSYVGQRVSGNVLSQRLIGIASQAEAAGFTATAELLLQAAVTALNEMPHAEPAWPDFSYIITRTMQLRLGSAERRRRPEISLCEARAETVASRGERIKNGLSPGLSAVSSKMS